MNAFTWYREQRDSIFMADPTFRANKSNGKTQSQTSSEFVSRHIAATGKSPGSIRGISGKGDSLIEQAEHDRRKDRNA